MMDRWTPEISMRSGPIYEAIVDALRRDIYSGRMPEGARLPTYRHLAQSLGVSLGTVTKAYSEARRTGLINGEPGRGMFVAIQSSVSERGYPAPAELGGYMDLTLNQPPIGALGEMMAEAFPILCQTSDLSHVCNYDLSLGWDNHRRAAQQWVRLGGVEVSPEDIILCAGAQQALFSTLLAFAGHDRAVMIEALSYPALRQMAQSLQVPLVGIEIDENGLVPDAFEAACRTTSAKLLICTPRGQNPTTVYLPEDRRRRILKIADTYGVTIVEDDVYGAFHEQDAPSFYELSGGRSVYINSISKCLAPGMRMGFIATEPKKLSLLRQAIYRSTWSNPGLIGELFTVLVNKGYVKDALEWHRSEIQKRHDLAHSVFGNRSFRKSKYCYHIWVHLPLTVAIDHMITGARHVGLLLTHTAVFSSETAQPPHALRLSLGRPSTIKSLRRALEQLEILMSTTVEVPEVVI